MSASLCHRHCQGCVCGSVCMFIAMNNYEAETNCFLLHVSLGLLICLKAATHSFCFICSLHNLMFVYILKVTSSLRRSSLYILSVFLLQYVKNVSVIVCSLLFYGGGHCKFIWSLRGCCILWLWVYRKSIGTELFMTLSVGGGSLWFFTASLFKLSEEIFQQLLAHKQQLPP